MSPFECEKSYLRDYVLQVLQNTGHGLTKLDATVLSINGDDTLTTAVGATTSYGYFKDGRWVATTDFFSDRVFVGSVTVSLSPANYVAGSYIGRLMLVTFSAGGVELETPIASIVVTTGGEANVVFNVPFVLFNNLRVRVTDISDGDGDVVFQAKFDGFYAYNQ